ncbi:MAG TPA: GNAT family N-acetyltransferase [Pyrinomonadaceae bacterium]|nr:GNAT family N-acetyltransferase [Pyrinomonadaceae bacterium]
MDSVAIIGFDERYAADFARLNYHWIAETYGIEPHDHDVLDHPHEAVISPGGEVFFALVGDEAGGTVAMIPYGDDSFELTKMAVDPTFRGRGLGDKLMQACIDFTREKGRRAVILESNTKQVAAIKLYRKFGFVEIPLDPNSQYVRANIRMELVV